MKLGQVRRAQQAADHLEQLRQMLTAENIEVFIDGKRQGLLVVGASRVVAHRAFRLVVLAAITETEADLAALGVEVD